MKQLNNLALPVLFIAFFIFGCKSNNGAGEPVTDESNAVCIYDKAPVYDGDGKYISTLELGEKIESGGDEKEIDIKGKKNKYTSVKLSNGKEGWVQTNLIAVGALPGVVTRKADVYKRPDLKTVTQTAFEPMDIIAVKVKQGDWVEVSGKRTGGKWIETAWLKADCYSEGEKDIAVALFYRRAMANATPAAKLEALKKLQNNSDFSGSVFDSKIKEEIEKLEAPIEEPQPVENETEEEHKHE